MKKILRLFGGLIAATLAVAAAFLLFFLLDITETAYPSDAARIAAMVALFGGMIIIPVGAISYIILSLFKLRKLKHYIILGFALGVIPTLPILFSLLGGTAFFGMIKDFYSLKSNFAIIWMNLIPATIATTTFWYVTVSDKFTFKKFRKILKWFLVILLLIFSAKIIYETGKDMFSFSADSNSLEVLQAERQFGEYWEDYEDTNCDDSEKDCRHCDLSKKQVREAILGAERIDDERISKGECYTKGKLSQNGEECEFEVHSDFDIEITCGSTKAFLHNAEEDAKKAEHIDQKRRKVFDKDAEFEITDYKKFANCDCTAEEKTQCDNWILSDDEIKKTIKNFQYLSPWKASAFSSNYKKCYLKGKLAQNNRICDFNLYAGSYAWVKCDDQTVKLGIPKSIPLKSE